MAGTSSYLGLAVVALLLFVILRAIYRVTLHPLAKFPGPKLAALSSAYQAWYDLRPGTSYIFEFPGLHKRYGKAWKSYGIRWRILTVLGPIVRITPDQLHVFDIAAYNE